MSTVLSFETANQRRLYTAGDFPLSIGGPGSHLELPDLAAGAPVAYLGEDGGEVFIQPAEGRSARPGVSCNGVALTASRWLADGDEIGIADYRLRCAVSEGSVRVALVPSAHPSDSDHDVSTPSRPSNSERMIRPADFTPRWQSPPPRARFRLRTRTLFPLAMGLVLAAAAWFVLTAHAVRIETVPTADRLEVRGGWPAPKIGDSYLLRPGTYMVEAGLAGYRGVSAMIEVDDDTPSVISFEFEPLGGLLTVTSSPIDNAEITIDGASSGTTPARDIEVAAGHHRIEVSAPLHLPYTTTLDFEPGGPPRRLEVELTPNWAPLTVMSTPTGAEVSVDGTVLGATPLEAKIEAGGRQLEIRRPGFKPFLRRLEVAAGEAVDLGSVRLVPVDGRLAVTSVPVGATVTVNDVFRGTAPLELPLAPGDGYRVAVSLAGHGTYTDSVAISSGRRTEVRAELEMLTGEVMVSSRPPGAQLVIDGTPSGVTDQTIELDARPHDIEIRLEGYETYRTTLTPEPGLPQAVHAVLREEGPGGMAPSIATPQGVDMVLVVPGRFTMGAPRREPGRRANEVLHEVELTQPYHLAVREVTNKEFREFRPDHQSGSVANHNLEIDHHPAVNVTWDEAARYCNWLSEKAGLPPVYVERNGRMVARTPFPHGYRLPTEAEWAWAARHPDAAGARKYAWGESLPIPAGAGNYGDASAALVLGGAIPGYRDNHAATAPAGSYQANPLGIFNLGGNVSEWVNDIYTVTPSAPGQLTTDPTGPSEGAYHVIRGASWMDTNVTELRLSYRDYGDSARPDLGFRVARSAH